MSNIWYLSYVVLSIPTLFLFRWRLDFCLIGGTALNALGGWLRYASGDNFAYAIIS